MVAELDPDDEYLLDVFRHLSMIRDEGLNGIGPLLPGRITDWCRTLGYYLHRDEIKVIFILDVAYRKAYVEEAERQSEMRTQRLKEQNA